MERKFISRKGDVLDSQREVMCSADLEKAVDSLRVEGGVAVENMKSRLQQTFHPKVEKVQTLLMEEQGSLLSGLQQLDEFIAAATNNIT